MCSKDFSGEALKQVSKRLATEDGQREYVLPHRTEHGLSLQPLCISPTAMTDKEYMAISYRRGSRAVRKRRGAGNWSLGGPFSGHYTDQEVMRV